MNGLPENPFGWLAEFDWVSIAIVAVPYALFSIFVGFVFQKAGQPYWIGLVPVYNYWRFFELAGYKGWWSILMLIPIVSLVASVVLWIAALDIGRGFQKPGPFVILFILVPALWAIWLGFDRSTWIPKPRPTAPPAARSE